MRREPTALPDVTLLYPAIMRDARGFFSERYSEQVLAALGVTTRFVQDNHAYSRAAGTVRGLHYQLPPFAQDKLLYVLKGAIFDVALDIRRGSPTFGRHVAVKLDAEQGAQILIPAGFAHGYCTLEPDCEVFYKVSRPYAPAHERGILWNDADLNIGWPVSSERAIVSKRDLALPRLRDATEIFN